jgi:hypothetical protein
MTSETGIYTLFRRHNGKSFNGRLAPMGIDMLFTGTMASFAARLCGIVAGVQRRFNVRILIEIERDVRVTHFAHLASDIGVRRFLRPGGRQGKTY